MYDIFSRIETEIVQFYENIRDFRVSPIVSSEEIRKFLEDNFDFSRELPLEVVVERVTEMLKKWNLHVTHPRYFGLYCPSVTFASIVADILVALYNPQLASWHHSPIGNEIEQFTLRYFLKKFGFDLETSIAHFTTGGAESNLTAVISALTGKFPSYGSLGLRGLKKQPVFYVSKEAHHSFLKVAHITGLGRESVRTVEVNDTFTMDIDNLEEQIKKDSSNDFAPFLVVGTAGTTSAGVIDPLDRLADVCKKNNLWFHVDAAWGGAAVISSKLKKYLKGIDRADSITCDAHKWLSVPMGAGMFFCKHNDVVKRSFYSETTYMPDKVSNTIDFYSSSIQWSRRFIGLKLFMTLTSLGESGLASMIENQVEVSKDMAERLEKNGWKIVSVSPFAVICFTHPRVENSLESIRKVLDFLYNRGQVWISSVILNERIPVFRSCVSSFRATREDVDVFIEEIGEAIKKV